MYKTRNKEIGNGICGTRGTWEMFYPRECRQTYLGITSNIPGNALSGIRKYESHRSILKIKSVFKSIRLFNFKFVSSDDISKIITSLDSTKKTSGVIPTKIVKLANKEICKDLANCINRSIKKSEL